MSPASFVAEEKGPSGKLLESCFHPGPMTTFVLKPLLQYGKYMVRKFFLYHAFILADRLVFVRFHGFKDGIIPSQVCQLHLSFGEYFLEVATVRRRTAFLADDFTEVADVTLVIPEEFL